MKIKEYMSTFKKLMKSKSLVILRCPYCDSVNIEYFKATLKEEEVEDNSIKKLISYGIGCKDCNAVAMINEGWTDILK